MNDKHENIKVKKFVQIIKEKCRLFRLSKERYFASRFFCYTLLLLHNYVIMIKIKIKIGKEH